jgi:hypothetical protein
MDRFHENRSGQRNSLISLFPPKNSLFLGKNSLFPTNNSLFFSEQGIWLQRIEITTRIGTKSTKSAANPENSLLNSLFSGNLGRPRAPSPRTGRDGARVVRQARA